VGEQRLVVAVKMLDDLVWWAESLRAGRNAAAA
jgi:hypothetical protein